MNLIITGQPGSGKTTLLREIIRESGQTFAGFFTDEIRSAGRRTGFKLAFLDGSEATLAHRDLKTAWRVGPYGVDLDTFEQILRRQESNLLASDCVIVDEIGKMELLSEGFRQLLPKLLEAQGILLASIVHRPHPFADKIKSRPDVRLFYLEAGNRSRIKSELVSHLISTRTQPRES